MDMRKIMVTLLAALLLPLGAAAQVNLEKAWKGLENVSFSQLSAVEKDKGHADENGKIWTYDACKFVIDKESNEFKALKDAFQKDHDEAYSAFVKVAGIEVDANEQISVVYGKNNSRSINYGSFKNRNYNILFFRDPTDERYRTCYALVWYDAGEKGKVECIMRRYYGIDPQSSGVMSNSTLTVREDGTIIKYDGNTRNSVIVKPNGNNNEDIVVNNAGEFLVAFNNLRADYMKIAILIQRANSDCKALFLTSAMPSVNKILLLCKNSGSLLNSDERTTVIASLERMKGGIDDSGIADMLTLAAKYLEKK